ncbi:thioredoxin [Brevundimonas sp. LM2]|uniref:thioredoxin domain-containing protein n=1 Tax=Brevundimonas sp. LM2 TaxID=1938605 RepID=UPI000983B931|nr:thioredoxin domain-containing protein [Brevundimonas sp. LM2]AQR62588.1 thioredoxin [Brevundimonas sp. LM2]
MRALILSIGLLLAPLSAPAQTPVPAESAGPPAVSAGDRVMGRADAPVTVIEYASLVCSHCGDWHRTVYPELKRRFIDTGQVRLVFRDYPTSPAPVAARAAGIARCAAPDRFYAVIGTFFDGHEALFAGGPVPAWLASGVAASGKTQAEIDACLADPATLNGLRASMTGATAAGVEGTPSFFVNGRAAPDRSIEGLTAAITPLLPRR